MLFTDLDSRDISTLGGIKYRRLLYATKVFHARKMAAECFVST